MRGAILNGVIAQLRDLETGKGAELGAAIALELNGKTYAPVHDHRGNICCLIDINTGEVAATYRYSAFGEAIIHSIVDNPWGFASKRLDSETGFLHFSKRYYSPHLGRWITPDPLGFADGPNLYAYVHNSPLSFIDPWGLAGQELYDRNRAGIGTGNRLNSPGIGGENRRNSDMVGCPGGCWGAPKESYTGTYTPITNGLKGCTHSLCDFFVEFGHGLETGFTYVGYNEMDCDFHDRCRMNESMDLAQANRSARIDAGIQSFLGIDPSDPVYQRARSYMSTGLQVASVAAGGYGVVKGLMYVQKIPMLASTNALKI